MQKIVDLLQTNSYCVFLGAGIPKVLGFPLWNELALKLVEFLWEEKEIFAQELKYSVKQELENYVKAGKPITAITYCRDLFCKSGEEDRYIKKIIGWLHDENKYEQAKENDVYVQLRPLLDHAVIIQTNIDKSIESYSKITAYTNNSLPTQIVVPSLIYLHGIVTDPKTWIFDREQYDSFYQRNPKFVQFIKSVFQSYDVLFLGYSLGDKEILDLVAKARSSEKKYLLVLEEIEKDKAKNLIFENDLSHYKIDVIRYSIENNGYKDFLNFLKRLNARLAPMVKLKKPIVDGSMIND